MPKSKAKAAPAAAKPAAETPSEDDDLKELEGLEDRGFPVKKYKEADTVMSLDQGRLYEAKVVRCGEDGQYFLHYQGWNKKWDKWVHASLMMKSGPEADKYAKKLRALEAKRQEAKKASLKRSEDGTGGGGKRKKPRIEVGRALEEVDDQVPELKLQLPFTLKKQLVDDWERVSQMDPNMLVTLPRTPTAEQVINQFLDFKAQRTSSTKQQNFSELLEGLKIYFDAALPIILLYAQERSQYNDVVARYPGVPPSKIYGAEHLLRVFTKLPKVLGRARLASIEASQLQTSLGEFLKFLQKNAGTFFQKDYEVYMPGALHSATDDITMGVGQSS